MSGALTIMSDNRSFMSASLPAHNNPATQVRTGDYPHGQDENAHFVASYPQDVEPVSHKRGTPSSDYVDRSALSTGRPSAQAYDTTVPLQLPSLNGAFQDPTRTLYGPGMGTGTHPGTYGAPTHSDENSVDTYRLPLTASTPSPHSSHDYQHQPEQLHQDSHTHYSQASYHDQYPRRDYHSNGTTSNIASSSSSISTYSHPRQHHPHTQMLPSMLYTTAARPDNSSSSLAFARPFVSTASRTYAHSHSSSSMSPQSGTMQTLPSTSVASNEERQTSAATQSLARPSTKRREKPKIELASDQPLTTQGKPRARVYVACVQCRTRKIRCDGAKPVCHNCLRRTAPTNGANSASSSTTSTSPTATSPLSVTSPTGVDALGPCCYDAAPKRRGPDKNPGSRQRISHAQRELELLQSGPNGTADGGKVRRRRRRDTTTVIAASAGGAPSAAQNLSTSPSRIEHAIPFDNHLPPSLADNLIVNTNIAGVDDSELPTHGAAQSPVGAGVSNASPVSGVGSKVTFVSVAQPISATRTSERVPSPLQVPTAHTTQNLGQQAIPNQSTAVGVMGSPESYRTLAPQGQRPGPHGVAQPHPMSYSHATELRDSNERAHRIHEDRNPGLQSAGSHRFSVSESAYPSMPVRAQIQVPSQAQQPRSHRTELPRLISSGQDYSHSDHQPIPHLQHPSPHGPPPGNLSNALSYIPYQLPPQHSGATISPIDEDKYEYEYDHDNNGRDRKAEIGAEPSVQFARETWWDTLLGLYLSHTRPQSHNRQIAASQNLTPGLRETLTQTVAADLRFLFRTSNFWFAFVNVPRFFARLLDPSQRTTLQPSFILAALACANFIRSSEQEDGQDGRTWSLTLLERAQSSLEASVNAQWVDESLVQASWFIAFFELSAHPMHNTQRARSSLLMLDNLIRGLSMAVLDSSDQRTSRWGMRSVPTIPSPPFPNSYSPTSTTWSGGPVSGLVNATPNLSSTSKYAHLTSSIGTHSVDHSASSSSPACHCGPLTLGQNWAHAQEHTPLWLMTPAWNRDVSDAEMRKEESRRVVWSAITLVAGYTSFVASINAIPTLDLFLMEPANIALLFPGESLVPALSSPSSPIGSDYTKHTVWALYMRTMLLWHSCIRTRWDTHQDDATKSQFAVGAWLEIDRIEKALDSHDCNIERAFLFQGREYLFNARMCISYEFRRFIPQATVANLAFHRKKAEDWLNHQASVAKRTMYGLQVITGQPNVTFARRPFFVFWFMSQVSRALLLWSCDHSLNVALDVSKALIGPIEYLMSIWPCPDQQRRYRDLRARLEHACLVASIPPPPPSNATPFRLIP